MSTKKDDSFKFINDLGQEEDIIIVRWNREEGDFYIHYLGRPMTITSAKILLDAVVQELESRVKPDGTIDFTEEEIDETDIEMEEDLPWLK